MYRGSRILDESELARIIFDDTIANGDRETLPDCLAILKGSGGLGFVDTLIHEKEYQSHVQMANTRTARALERGGVSFSGAIISPDRLQSSLIGTLELYLALPLAAQELYAQQVIDWVAGETGKRPSFGTQRGS